MERLEAARSRLAKSSVTSDAAKRAGLQIAQNGLARTALDLLAMPSVTASEIQRLWPDVADLDRGILELLRNDACYLPYADRQARDIAAMRANQERTLPAGTDYAAIPGLSRELAEKLSAVRPQDLAQAARIDGMTPAALALLLAHARRPPQPVA
jgi:tRNA uridine 5-carboxymethylaminomethyl modification enzyme